MRRNDSTKPYPAISLFKRLWVGAPCTPSSARTPRAAIGGAPRALAERLALGAASRPPKIGRRTVRITGHDAYSADPRRSEGPPLRKRIAFLCALSMPCPRPGSAVGVEVDRRGGRDRRENNTLKKNAAKRTRKMTDSSTNSDLRSLIKKRKGGGRIVWALFEHQANVNSSGVFRSGVILM